MKFSIVTPTRNRLEKLKRCVGSVRGQTGVELEHIIQDACSTDGTAEWLSTCSDLNAKSEPDTGMYDAINRGWERASGDIFCWLNSDEQYLPGALKSVHEVFNERPDVDFVFGDIVIVDGGGGILAARREIRLSRMYIANTFLNAASCATFYRRRLWDEGALRLDDRLRYAADMELILRLLDLRKKPHKISRYLAVFTVDGTNLSYDSAMLAETAQVQKMFGALSCAPLRKAIRVGRWLERLLSGSYRRASITYRYAVDEIPTYREVSAHGVPGTFRLERG